MPDVPAPPPTASPHVALACLAAFVVAWVGLALQPFSRDAWLLENLPTMVIVPMLVVTWPRFRFSGRAYVQGLVFLLIHTIGSHYTYARVPFGEWLQATFDLSRNHFDRLAHGLFGFLLFLPTRELVFRSRRELRIRTELLLTWTVIGVDAMGYELVEWWIATLADPGAGQAFLAIQGDEWDAQKDMALAVAGGAVAMAVEAFVERPRWRHGGRNRPE